ncbi:hypothetical protein KI387_000348, partial [Taxus chinensis]
MDKKAKSLGNRRLSHSHNQGSFPKSSSFNRRFSLLHGEPLDKISDPKSKEGISMRRPKTHPELLNRDKPAFERTPWLNLEMPPVLRKSGAKLLVNVTVLQSIGALRVLMPTDGTVVDVITATLALYAKEGRRPILSTDPLSFGLHYSQFTIDCLNPNDKMKDLGSRNFFLCPKKQSIANRECYYGSGRNQSINTRNQISSVENVIDGSFLRKSEHEKRFNSSVNKLF